MKNRLEKFLEAENISQAQFAETIGVTPASISHIISGRNKPGYDFIVGVMDHFPTLSLDWLLRGKGKMYSDTLPAPDETPREIIHEPQRKTVKIMVFYDDGTFEEFS